MGQNYTAYRGPSKRDVQCSTTPKMTICQTYLAETELAAICLNVILLGVC
jgi:hypothetical protein